MRAFELKLILCEFFVWSLKIMINMGACGVLAASDVGGESGVLLRMSRGLTHFSDAIDRGNLYGPNAYSAGDIQYS